MKKTLHPLAFFKENFRGLKKKKFFICQHVYKAEQILCIEDDQKMIF